MSIAFFDCSSGVSGDMMLGALADLGLDMSELTDVLSGMGLSNFELKAEKVKKQGITATNLHVITAHEHVHRHLSDILRIVQDSGMNDAVKGNIEKVFRKIAEAEAKVHGIPIEKVHFHEVGALDSIIDIAGSVWGLDRLGITKCYSSAVSLGVGNGRMRPRHDTGTRSGDGQYRQRFSGDTEGRRHRDMHPDRRGAGHRARRICPPNAAGDNNRRRIRMRGQGNTRDCQHVPYPEMRAGAAGTARFHAAGRNEYRRHESRDFSICAGAASSRPALLTLGVRRYS